MFWSIGWSWAGSTFGGYGGIQAQGTNINQTKRQDQAVFSIWNAVSFEAGSPGSACRAFGGEGTGFTCIIPIVLRPNVQYTFTFAPMPNKGPQWWKALLSYHVPNSPPVSVVVGKLQSPMRAPGKPFTNNGGTLYNFIEYFGNQVGCNAVPLASADFSAVSVSDCHHQPVLSSFQRPASACVNSAADTTPIGTNGNAFMRFGGKSQAPTTAQVSRQVPAKKC